MGSAFLKTPTHNPQSTIHSHNPQPRHTREKSHAAAFKGDQRGGGEGEGGEVGHAAGEGNFICHLPLPHEESIKILHVVPDTEVPGRCMPVVLASPILTPLPEHSRFVSGPAVGAVVRYLLLVHVDPWRAELAPPRDFPKHH